MATVPLEARHAGAHHARRHRHLAPSTLALTMRLVRRPPTTTTTTTGGAPVERKLSPPTTERNRQLTASSSTGSPNPTPTLRPPAPPSRGASLADRKPCVPRSLPAKEVANGFLNLEQVEQAEQTGQLQKPPATVKGPLPPKAAYSCFVDREREKLCEAQPWVHTTMTADGRLVVPDASRHAGDITCEVARRWKALNAEQRQHWVAASEKDQKRYLAECAERGVQPKVFAHMPGQVGAARPDDEQGGTGKVSKPTQHAARPAPYIKRSTAPGGAPNSARACGAFALRPDAAPKAKQRIARPAAGEKWIATPNGGTTQPACCLVVGFFVNNAGQLVRPPAPTDQD